MKGEIRLVIADDHPIFRQGLRQVIEKDPHLKVVAEADNGEAALEQIAKLGPEAVLLDVEMPEKDGFAVVRSLRSQGLPVKIIFLTMYKDELHFNEALNLGVNGYIIKDSAATEVVNCIKVVVAGESYVSPALSSHLLNRHRRASTLVRQQPGLAGLTQTELRILGMLAEYRTNREIAGELGVSVRTIENHRSNICVKLDLRGAHALVKFALAHKSELS
jgi:DNA-binding NarL/FixJ family response regulator